MIFIKSQNSKLTAGIISALLCLAVFFAGTAKSLLCPVDEIPYENRPADKYIKPGINSYWDKSFQDSVENTLSDQVHAAIKMKKLYNIIDTRVALPVIEKLLNTQGGYISFRDIYFYGDALVSKAQPLENKAAALEQCAETLNRRLADTDAELFLYYVETDKDIDFESGTKVGNYEHLSSMLDIPASNIDRLELNSFEQYRENFLHTDHHWNAKGAYLAYLDICKMLHISPIESRGLHSIGGIYRGTRAAGIEGIDAENFTVNIFDYPPMDIFIDGQSVPDYGMQQQFIDGQMQSFSYGSVFGADCAELAIHTALQGEKLLVLGDSYDNAIAKALAAGFSETYFIDLRAYANFDLAAYTAEYGIDKVLFIGAVDYFCNTLY